MIQIEIKHENDNRSEWGYGLYINGYLLMDDRCNPPFEGGLYASECIPRNSSDEAIKAAEHRVRQNARNAYKREFANV